jgi:hypothetical protein
MCNNMPIPSPLGHFGYSRCPHESDHPFDDFKAVFLGQFGKST